MRDAVKLHQKAMMFADEALMAKSVGNHERARTLNRDAFCLERRAALRLLTVPSEEPSRSVLARSAASLALECEEFREAEKLIGLALAGDPPQEIADELRVLLEDVYFQRHLSLGGVQLFPEEFQLSMWGPAIGSGIANSREFVHRAQKVETLVHRTAERKLALPYRDSGRRKKDFKEKLDLYISAGRAASYSVTFRIGGYSPPEFPELSLAKAIIDEILQDIVLLEGNRLGPLRSQIGDDAYFNNFMGLIRDIAPDGKDIKAVGFTCSRAAHETRVTLATPRKSLPFGTKEPRDAAESDGAAVKVRGVLKFADSLSKAHNTIKLEGNEGKIYEIVIPPGMMRDIVRPRWGEEVEILAIRGEGRLVLETIDLAE